MEVLIQGILTNTWALFGVIAIIWVSITTLGSVIKALSRERTKRDIAAYIAEGSMTPEQGEQLLRAGRVENSSCCGS